MMMIFLVFLMTEIKHLNVPGSYEFILNAGQYTVRCYGAQGGNTYSDGVLYNNTGGHGAYARGTMTVTGKGTTFYAFVGGMGKTHPKGQSEGGFNGGGKSGEDYGNGATGGSDDGSGGGGGATDLRINDNSITSRIIVAGGGSGGSWKSKGAYGGKYKVVCAVENNVYEESDNEKDFNRDGQGGTGEESYYQPGSGGGGGYLGGRGGDWCNQPPSSFYTVGCSGSSYISGDENCEPNQNMQFFNTEIYPNYKDGDGLLIIEQDFQCSSNCEACTSETTCTLCSNNYYLSEGKCVEKCPDSTYNGPDSKCHQCDSNCENCAQSSTHCTSCYEGSFLQDSKCVNRCSEGSTPVGSICVDCKKTCKTCSSSPSECETCEVGYVKYENSCVLECPEKFVRMKYSCELCKGECETCSIEPTNCTSCKNGFYLYNNRCLPSCPNKFFNQNGVCVNCSSPCEDCSSVDSCLTCENGLFLYNNHCYEKCPEGTSAYGNGCIQDV